MDDVVVLEATDHVNDSVYLTDVRKEFVAKTLSLGGTLYKPRDVHKFDDGGGVFFGVVHLCQKVQTAVGNGDHAHIGLDGAEGIVCRLRTCVGQCVKESTFSYVGKSYDTKFHFI